MTTCYEHDYVSHHCINCGGYLGEVCEVCGDVTDGGDWKASQTEMWCNCNNPISDYGREEPEEEDQDDFHHSRYMDGAE